MDQQVVAKNTEGPQVLKNIQNWHIYMLQLQSPVWKPRRL